MANLDLKKHGKIIISYASNSPNQLFVVNKNRTVSPVQAPNLVWGLDKYKQLMLVESTDIHRRIIFAELRPNTFSPVKQFKLVVSSHKNKGIVLQGDKKQLMNGQEQFLKLGSAQNAISVFIDADGLIHNSAQPFQVLDS